MANIVESKISIWGNEKPMSELRVRFLDIEKSALKVFKSTVEGYNDSEDIYLSEANKISSDLIEFTCYTRWIAPDTWAQMLSEQWGVNVTLSFEGMANPYGGELTYHSGVLVEENYF